MKNVAFSAVIVTAFLFTVFASAAAQAQSDIHSVDFRNFTYPAYCAGDEAENVAVKNGEISKETQMDGFVDRFYFNIFSVAYGDLTGDGKDEAVILSVCNTGGTGNFSEGFIYSMRNGKPALIARIAGGDRAYGGLRSATVENAVLVVDSNDPGENGANCCPEFALKTRYRLVGGKLNVLGKPARRELFPTERVSFTRGTSGSTFDLEIPEQEGRRFVVGARAGQTLKVSTNSDKVSLRLLDETEVTEGINNFTARLPRNGDYTFEIQNNAAGSVKITVNVKIQ